MKPFKKFLAFTLIFALMLSFVPELDIFSTVAKEVTKLSEVTHTHISENSGAKETDIPSSGRISTGIQYNPLYDAPAVSGSSQKYYSGNGAVTVNEEDYLTSVDDVAAVLRAEMVERNADINLKYRVPTAQCDSEETFWTIASELFELALEHTGIGTEGDALRWVWSFYSIDLSYMAIDDSYYLEYTFHITYYTTAEQEQALTERVEEVLSSFGFDDNTDDYTKVKTVYDYICANVVYDYTNLNDDTHKLKYTAYAALINGTAVCQGYAILLYRMLLDLGIDCRVITGTSNNQNHAWNIVELNGIYYNLDSTWDSEAAQAGLEYKYFLKNNAKFTDHTREPRYLTEEFTAKYPMSNLCYGETAKWTDYAADTFSGGDGSGENPFLIASPAELALMAFNINNGVSGAETANYRLISDIDLSAYEWEPIITFSGVLDGQGYTISNMQITTVTERWKFGFFENINNATIQNISFDNCVLSINDPFDRSGFVTSFALLVGAGSDSTIKNCNVKGSVNCTSTGMCEGLLVGIGTAIVVENVQAEGSFTATATDGSLDIGGLIGRAEGEITIVSSCFKGTIDAYANNAGNAMGYDGAVGIGGLIGYCFGVDFSINNCFAFVEGNIDITSGIYVAETGCGGLVGEINLTGLHVMQVKDSYAASAIKVSSLDEENAFCRLFGQFAPFNSSVLIENCAHFSHNSLLIYDDVNISKSNVVLSLSSEKYWLTEHTISELFIETLGYDTDSWNIQDGYYPCLVNGNSCVIPTSYNHTCEDALCIICGAVDTSVHVEGVWGNLNWCLDSGVLTISGTGDMETGVYNDITWRREYPWSNYGFHTVIVEEGVTSIATKAFEWHSEFRNIVLPSSLRSIDFYAFANSGLETIEIPSNVNPPVDLLSSCDELKSINVNKDNPYYSSIDGILYSKDGKTLFCVPRKYTGEVVVPYGVTTIDGSAFTDCRKVDSVILPESLLTIEPHAFAGCNLKKIEIPASVQRIETRAFAHIPSLETIIFRGGALEIATDAFYTVSAVVYYPESNSTWNESTKQNYGGTLTWVGYSGSHIHIYTLTVTEPTCTEGGYTTHTCECGDSYVDTYTEATHNIVDWYTTKSPTCISAGEEKRECANCVHFETRELDKLAHTYVDTVTEPTCTEQGYTTHRCNYCNYSYVDSYVDATGHTYGEWILEVEATCVDSGSRHKTCTSCENVVTETLGLDMTKHTTTGGFCYRCKSVVIEMGVYYERIEVGITSTGGSGGIKEYLSSYAVADSDTITIGEESDFFYGYKLYIKGNVVGVYNVTVYGKHLFGSYEEAFKIKVYVVEHDHDEQPINAVEPTCSSVGLTEGVRCSECEEVLVEQQIVPKLRHKVVKDAGKEATCTDPGLTEGFHCSVCNEVINAQEIVAAKGHIYDDWYTVVEPTCTENGTAERKCSVCQYTETKEIDKRAHIYSANITPPTCTEQGYTTHFCLYACGYIYIDEYVDATGHTYSDWYTVKEPTCTSVGADARTCSICLHLDTRELDKLPHTYTAVVTPPTCTEQGYTTHTCECGDSYVDTYTEATGHSFGEWYTTVAPTESTQGEKRRDCSECDAYEIAVLEVLDHDHYRWELIVLEAKDPTCTASGLTEGTKCSKCGEILTPQTEIPATGHTYGEWHTTKAPTCTEKGEEKRECENCDHFETRELDKAEHTYTAVVTKPTCTEQGYTTHTCECGDSYVDTYTEALGHSFTNYVSDGNATLEADGTKTALCDHGCGTKDTVTDEGSKLEFNDITSDIYEVKDGFISGISIKTTVKELKESVNETEYVRVVKDGKVVEDNTALATGMKLQLVVGDKVIKEVTVVVTGDTNGDGNISVTDMISVKAHILKKSTLTDAYSEAGDTNGDGGISITDFIQIKAHILGKSSLEKKSVKTVDAVKYNAAPNEKENAETENGYSVCVADFLVPQRKIFFAGAQTIKRSF